MRVPSLARPGQAGAGQRSQAPSAPGWGPGLGPVPPPLLSTLSGLPPCGCMSAAIGCPVTHAAGEASSRPQGRWEGHVGMALAHTWSPGSGDFARCSEQSQQVGPALTGPLFSLPRPPVHAYPGLRAPQAQAAPVGGEPLVPSTHLPAPIPHPVRARAHPTAPPRSSRSDPGGRCSLAQPLCHQGGWRASGAQACSHGLRAVGELGECGGQTRGDAATATPGAWSPNPRSARWHHRPQRAVAPRV